MSGRLSIGVVIQLAISATVRSALFFETVALLLFPSTTAECAQTAHSHRCHPIAVVAICRLAVVPRNSICKKHGIQSSHVLDFVCKLKWLDVDTRRNDSTARDESKPR